jgi:hypothetical protein
MLGHVEVLRNYELFLQNKRKISRSDTKVYSDVREGGWGGQGTFYVPRSKQGTI